MVGYRAEIGYLIEEGVPAADILALIRKGEEAEWALPTSVPARNG